MSIVLEEVGAIRFRLQTEEWPKEAKRLGLEDPFKRIYQQNIFEEVDGPFGKATKILKNPDAPPYPTMQERADYRFEEEKFVCRRLAELGFWDALSWDIEHAFTGNQERLAAYVATLKPCSGTGQCNMNCMYYNGGCTIEEDL